MSPCPEACARWSPGQTSPGARCQTDTRRDLRPGVGVDLAEWFLIRNRSKTTILPLPLGEGWGEGRVFPPFRPHPSPLPEGEGTHATPFETAASVTLSTVDWDGRSLAKTGSQLTWL